MAGPKAHGIDRGSVQREIDHEIGVEEGFANIQENIIQTNDPQDTLYDSLQTRGAENDCNSHSAFGTWYSIPFNSSNLLHGEKNYGSYGTMAIGSFLHNVSQNVCHNGSGGTKAH